MADPITKAVSRLMHAGVLNPSVNVYTAVGGITEYTVASGEPRWRDIPNPYNIPRQADYYEYVTLAKCESLSEAVEAAILQWTKDHRGSD